MDALNPSTVKALKLHLSEGVTLLITESGKILIPSKEVAPSQPATPRALSVTLSPYPTSPGQKFNIIVQLLDENGNPVTIKQGWTFEVTAEVRCVCEVYVPAEESATGEEIRTTMVEPPVTWPPKRFKAPYDCLKLLIPSQVPLISPELQSYWDYVESCTISVKIAVKSLDFGFYKTVSYTVKAKPAPPAPPVPGAPPAIAGIPTIYIIGGAIGIVITVAAVAWAIRRMRRI